MKCTRSGLLGLILALSGCVGPVTLAPLPYAHPASPSAPAGVIPKIGTALDGATSESGTGNEKMNHAGMSLGMPMSDETGKESGKFQCPMHADVRSDKPGRCHICGMKLVETKSDTHGAHE